MKKFQTLRGTKDVIGAEALVYEEIEDKAKQVLRDFDFLPIRTPIMEDRSLFQQSVGETSDIVQKEMFLVTRDAWDESEPRDAYCLRPEGTAAVVRAYIQSGLQQERPVNKLYYYGPMFRAERPQKGRFRQFHQIGGEIIGSKSVLADVENIEVLINILKKLGVADYRLEINNLGEPEDRVKYSTVLKGYLAGNGSLCKECAQRLEKNILRVFDCKNESCQGVLKDAPKISDHISEESKDNFKTLQEYLRKIGIPFVHNPRIVRGLDYYTHAVFEVKHSVLGEGAQNTLAAGGRYNRLVKQLGGQDTPAVGFAIGMERLILTVENSADKAAPRAFSARKLAQPWAAVVWSGAGAKFRAYEMLSKLRSRQIRSYMNFDKKSFGEQLGLASKLNVPFAVILGESEMADRSFLLRNLITRQETRHHQDTFENNAIDIIEKDMKRAEPHA